MRKINHFGVPTTIPQPGEVYAEGLKVWLNKWVICGCLPSLKLQVTPAV